MSQYGLGRGLDALIARKKTPAQNPVMPRASAPSRDRLRDEDSTELPVDLIDSNDMQPRKEFGAEALRELGESIKEYGIIQPLVVSKNGNRYRLIAGERRLRASKLIGLKSVPVVFREADEHERLAVALIENIQRVDLNPIELAHSYRKLIDEFSLKQDELARRVGKSRPVITNTLRILNLPSEIQDAIRDGLITSAHSRAILSIPTVEGQRKLFQETIEQGLDAAGADRRALEISQKKRTTRYNTNPDLAHKEAVLRDHFGTRVTIKKKGKNGSIIIDFYSDDEMNAILAKMISY
ncbi:MAG: ParB/RepB/Spo0J family partition protein [Patescibacteria group bacterium]